MTTTAQPTLFDELKTALRGPLIQPGDDGYDTARAVYNAMIDRRPAAIARCADVADVMTARPVRPRTGLTVAVRGGGHNAGGPGRRGTTRSSSTCRRCAAITVDPAARPCASTAAAPGVTSTTPPARSAWPPRPGSCPPPASAG